jgi:hypothetical protein
MHKASLTILLLVGVATAGAAAARSPTARFVDRGDGVSFNYPRSWRPQYAGYQGLGRTPIVVVLSTSRVGSPCQSNGTGGTLCGLPRMLDPLPAEGICTAWFIDDNPRMTPGITGYPGAPTRIGGLQAKLLVDATGAGVPAFCPNRTTSSVTAFISPFDHHGPLIVAACANTQNFSSFKSKVLAMLRSASFRR